MRFLNPDWLSKFKDSFNMNYHTKNILRVKVTKKCCLWIHKQNFSLYFLKVYKGGISVKIVLNSTKIYFPHLSWTIKLCTVSNSLVTNRISNVSESNMTFFWTFILAQNQLHINQRKEFQPLYIGIRYTTMSETIKPGKWHHKNLHIFKFQLMQFETEIISI